MNGPGKILRDLVRLVFLCAACVRHKHDIESIVDGRNREKKNLLRRGKGSSRACCEESLYIFDGLGLAVGRKRVQKDAAVALALDAGVQEHEDAAVLQ